MRKGSIREKTKPVISLKNLSDRGLIVIANVEYKTVDPPPDSWVMVKPGDIIISKSGTIRHILKKNWSEGAIESLRITWDQEGDRLEASLEVEELEIDSSNIEFMTAALRPVLGEEAIGRGLKPEHFTRAVRYNILTLLGFGKIGYEIHNLMPPRDKRSPQSVSLIFLLDTANNILIDVCVPNTPRDRSKQKVNCVEIAALWQKKDKTSPYQLTEIAYPPGVTSPTLEVITLACEMANAFSLANEINTKN